MPEGFFNNMPENLIETIRLLVVSKEPAVLRPLWSLGEYNSWQVETAANGWEAMERVQSGVAPHVLLLDLPRGDGDSLHILRWMRRLRRPRRVRFLTIKYSRVSSTAIVIAANTWVSKAS